MKREFNYGTFYCGDASEIIKEIGSCSVNLILTDPPYGLGFGPYDNPDSFYKIEDELYRVASNNSWLVFFWSVKKLGEPMSRLKRFSFCWQIIAEHYSAFTKSPIGCRRYQSILVFKKGNPRVSLRGPDIMLSFELPGLVSKVGNPLFKSTGLIAQLLSRFGSKDGIVLDPFAGLGTIPLICEVFGYRWIAFEIFQEWYMLACEFIEKKKILLGKDEIKRRINALQLRWW